MATQPLGTGRPLRSLAFVLVLAGCAVGPEYSAAPGIDVGAGWIDPVDEAARRIDPDTWWRVVGDPELARLVEEGLERNLDARQAVLRIAEARAALAAAESRRLPAVAARGGADTRRLSENGVLPVGRLSGIQREDTIYDAGFDAVWEVDLFGRVSRSIESANARADATAEDAQAVRISVAAEIARTYFRLRGAQRERAARAAGIAALEGSLELTQQRLELGDLPGTELDAVAARLAVARAALPGIEARIRDSAIALGTLLGGLPERELVLANDSPVDLALPAIPVGQRADLLRRRPDVRSAERRLAAATADVGIAVAEQFPKLTISAAGGFQALAPGDLWESGSQVYSVAPLVSWRIFDGGRVAAEIRSAEARADRAALAYEQAVLSALGEAERALSDYRHVQDAIAAQDRAVAMTTRVHANATARFAAGDANLQDVLDAERDLQDARELEARVLTDGATGLVSVYKALGGGWACGAACSATNPPLPAAP